MTENILNLKNPMLYRCHLYRYYAGLSRVYMRAFYGQQQEPAFYLLFSDVGYIEGAVSWQGVDFKIAPEQECIDLMLKTGMIGEAVLQFPDAYASITDTAKLYVTQTMHQPTRIIASSVTMFKDIPAELK